MKSYELDDGAVMFGMLKQGDLFRYANEDFIKTEPMIDVEFGFGVNSVCMSNGYGVRFDYRDTVKKISK